MKRFNANPVFGLSGILALAALAGCSGSSDNGPPVYCPQVAVLEQASSLTAFLPGHTDIRGQITQAKITGVAGSCDTFKKNQMLHVTFKAGFSATNGPANNNQPVVLPYFVAITNGDNIISKTNYVTTLKFDGNVTAAQMTTQPVKIELSNTTANNSVEILVGFQLSPDQLAYQASHQSP
jgi:hypothetical protein